MGRFKYILLPIILLLCLNNAKSKDGIIYIPEDNGRPVRLERSIDNPLLWEPKIPLFEVDTFPPVPIWKLECDGSIKRARVCDMPDDKNIRTGLNLIFMQPTSFNYDFLYNPDDFPPGSVCADWGLSVKNPKIDARAVITFTDRRGNDTTITIEYFAPKVKIKPNPVSFGIVEKRAQVFTYMWLFNNNFKQAETVKRLEMKDKNKGFSISEINLPVTILPSDSVKFKINFIATEEGKFIDSIGFGDSCVFFYSAQVEAEVRQSIINVSDASFEDLAITQSTKKIVEIRNDGNVDLYITGYKGPANSVFTTNLPEISSLKPLIIKPDDPPFKFNVTFSPKLEETYHDSIVFFSDADVIDSVAILNGNGIQPGMISTSYDWGRRRTGNEYEAGNQCITIKNTSDEDVIIYGFATKVDSSGTVFEFDRKLLENVTIPVGDSIYVPVKFKPIEVGKYELVLAYDNSINSQTETRLYGIGVKPIMVTSAVTFDTSAVAQPKYPIHDTIKFENVDWEFGDTIKINDLQILPNGDEISTDIERWGRLGFKFDKKALHLPKILLPGDKLIIPMLFVAKDTGFTYAAIRTISNIEPEDTAYINGFGIKQDLKITPTYTKPPSICVASEETITYLFENLGSDKIDIKDNAIEPDSIKKQFRFEIPSDVLGFELEPGQTNTVNIIYKPDKAGLSRGHLVSHNDMLYDNEVRTPLEGEGIQKSRNIRVNLMQENNLIKVGSIFQCNIMLEPGDDIDIFDIKELSFQFNFNGGIIKTVPEDVRIGELLEGRFQINNLEIRDNPGIIRLTLDTLTGIPNQKLDGNGELLKIIFHTYLPNAKDTSDKSILEPILIPITNSCVDFPELKTTTVQIDPICLYNITKIQINKLNYGFGAINPNPVSSENSSVVYSIGLEGNTKFEIMNSQGNCIYTVTYSNQKPGFYTFDIPSSVLESGVYWCRMISGPYTATRELVIIK
ncbi:MAG: T9SS type A sorting domain-containing protein [Ignavibacteriae bacterium]|nr:T9SS type A sorting domain-containing protein [Ignavibacteriota bacterium]